MCIRDSYNPVRTELLLQAEKLGIPCANGMVMLAAQAIRASEIFTGKKAASGALEHAIDLVKSKTMNIVLIGMPGCGKSAVAEALGKALGREVLDTDAYIEEHTGYTPEQMQNTIFSLLKTWGHAHEHPQSQQELER